MSISQNSISQSDIYKAQFCRQYFIELKQFLNDFDISDKEDGSSANDLNMHCLLEDSLNAYRYRPKHGETVSKKEVNEKSQAYRDERRFDIHWHLGVVNEVDLMIAIEQFFEITSDESYGDESIDLKENRNLLISYLLDKSNSKTVDFEDYTLRAILTTFNIIEEGNSDMIGNQVLRFSSFANRCPGAEQRFKWALVLLKELRNWKSHQGPLPYQIVQLTLLHKYILFTYIGLVYVCRRIWQDAQIAEKLEKGKGKLERYLRPSKALEFKIPEEEIHIVVRTGKNSKSTRCFYSAGNDDWEEIEIDDKESQELSFVLHSRKYKPFKLKILSDGDEEPFITHRELNYYSWFLTLEINVPKVLVIYKGIAGDDAEIGRLVSQIAEKMESHLDGEIKDAIQGGLVKLEPLLQLLRQPARDSKEDFNSLRDTIKDSLNNLYKMLDSQGEQFTQIEENFSKLLIDYDATKKAKIERDIFDFTWIHLVWLIPVAAFVYFYVVCDKWDRNLIWLEQKWMLGVVAATIVSAVLIIYRFGYLKVDQRQILRPWYKWADHAVGGALTLVLLLFPLSIPYRSANSFIRAYNFPIHDKNYNERAVEYVEKYLAENSESEHAMIMLATYYLNYSNNIKEALRVTKPMQNIAKYPNGCVIAAEVLYTCGDLLGVKNIIDKYAKRYPDKHNIGLDRLHALLLIEGDTPNPDQGLEILYILAENYNYPQACYDLGHWSSTDLAQWRPGTFEVASLRYDLPTAVKYLRRVAISMPKAAIELGNLYAELGVMDSAQYYMEMAVALSKGELNTEALFNLGLILEHQGQTENEPMDTVLSRDYAPAIEHKAILEENHKSAIAYMKRAGKYKGPRTIPPIVFEYLKAEESRDFINLSDSALKELQDLRPECHFNATFVKAMKAIMGTEQRDINLDSALELLRQSAQEGCLYAKMMCAYQDAINEINNGSKSVDVATLWDIERTIPFAGVLLSDLYIRAAQYGNAIKTALYPLSMNNPAAAFILSAIPWNYNFGSDTNNFLEGRNSYVKELVNSYVLQKIVRLSPYRNRWLFNCLNSDKRKRSLSKDSSLVSVLWGNGTNQTNRPAVDYYYANYQDGSRLWVDAISVGNSIDVKLFASWCVNELPLREKFVSSALQDLQQNNYKDEEELWKHLIVCADKCSSDFKQALLKGKNYKRHYDEFSGSARGRIDIKGPSFLLFKPFDLYDQLDEFTQLIKELDQIFMQTKDEP